MLAWWTAAKVVTTPASALLVGLNFESESLSGADHRNWAHATCVPVSVRERVLPPRSKQVSIARFDLAHLGPVASPVSVDDNDAKVHHGIIESFNKALLVVHRCIVVAFVSAGETGPRGGMEARHAVRTLPIRVDPLPQESLDSWLEALATST